MTRMMYKENLHCVLYCTVRSIQSFVKRSTGSALNQGISFASSPTGLSSRQETDSAPSPRGNGLE